MSSSRGFPNSTLSSFSLRPLPVLRGIVGWVFSFEFIFVVFLFAGVIKRNPKLSWIPVDLTGASFAISVVVGIFWLYRHGWKIRKSLLALQVSLVLFFGWAVLSLAWSESWAYGAEKAVYLALMGFWGGFAGAVIIGPDRKRVKRFCASLVFLSFFLAAEVVAHLVAGTLLEDWDFASNYLGLGRLLGLAVLILISILLWGNIGVWKGVAVGVLGGFLLVILMIAGGRGPLLATLGALVVLPICESRLIIGGLTVRRKMLLFSGFLILLLVGFVTVGNQFFGFTTIDRLMVLLEGGGGNSAHFRIWFFSNAWEFWWEAPFFGHGIGEFGALLGWGDIRVYPHNIFLEILVELGLVGLGLFLMSIYFALRHFSIGLLRYNHLLAMLFMFVLCAFFNAQVSGDLPDNRVLIALLALFAGRSEKVCRPFGGGMP